MMLVDGVEDSKVSAADRGLAYGDGVFRTLAATGGVPRQWPRHYAKLAADCAAIALACPAEPLLRREIGLVCAGAGDSAIKIVVTRGAGPRGYRYPARMEPTRLVSSAPLPDYPASYAEIGVRVRRCRLRLSEQPALAGVKHLNRLENVLARAEWDDPQIAEGLLCDARDHVIGGTMTNVFIATRGVLATPELGRCGVAGVTRERVLEAASGEGVPCRIADLPWSDVLEADEVILVNSLAGAWPVREIDGRAIRVGPLARLLQTWIGRDDAPAS
jgi:4-amino-4-deoxychorismate lyase